MRRMRPLLLCLIAGVPGLLDAQGPPLIMTDGIVNAASFASPAASNGSLAPGSIVTLFGTNLASVPAQATTTPLPTNLSDIDSVIVGGLAAPLSFVSPTQINLQIPFEAVPGTLNVTVSRSGNPSAPQAVNIVPASPGIFTMDSSGQGVITNLQGAIVNGSA